MGPGMTSQKTIRLLPAVAALALLFVAGAWAAMHHLSALQSADVWWRLRTGQWMLQHHALPGEVLFTQRSGMPWTVSGWGFDVLLAASFRVFGLRAIPLVSMMLSCAAAAILFVLAGGRNPRRWLPAAATALIALWILGPLPCDPAGVSVLLYGIVLALLLDLRANPSGRSLYAVPVLFLAWAVLAPEFLWGALLIVLFVADAALREWIAPDAEAAVRAQHKRMMGVLLLSPLVPLLTPYSYHLYGNFMAELYSGAAFKYLAEMSALGFRRPRDFAFALFLMAAFFVLGRSRNRFLTLALLAGLPIAFRIQRDAWPALLPAVAVYACLWDGEEAEEKSSRWLTGAALAALMLVLIGGRLLLSPVKIEQTVEEKLPVQAAAYVAGHRLPGPIYQTSAWGGYMIYALPEYPVALDSRFAAYGDEAYDEQQKLLMGEVTMDSDPAFAQARTIILPANTALAQAMKKHPALRSRFQAVYEDKLAAVFVAQSQAQPQPQL